ncbi:MAG: hypothetical protein FJ291_09045 [Planctomycetes bacterium]|nr:hypothetical protein [Planctomycetota bacterium]
MASPESGAILANALSALAEVYGQLDAELAALGVECRACGRCCDFARNGYRLYACHLEMAPILRSHGQPRLDASGRCCFLADGRCSVRPWRPLGCRAFFCDPYHRPREQDLYHAFQQRLRRLTERYGLPWDYAPFFGGVAH